MLIIHFRNVFNNGVKSRLAQKYPFINHIIRILAVCYVNVLNKLRSPCVFAVAAENGRVFYKVADIDSDSVSRAVPYAEFVFQRGNVFVYDIFSVRYLYAGIVVICVKVQFVNVAPAEDKGKPRFV